MEKDEQLVKKIISLVVLPIILIGLITLTIFYFLNPQIKYIYQSDKSIGIDYNKVFATLSTPTDIATDSKGNVYVLNGGSNIVQSIQLMVHLLKNGTSISWYIFILLAYEFILQSMKEQQQILQFVIILNKTRTYILLPMLERSNRLKAFAGFQRNTYQYNPSIWVCSSSVWLYKSKESNNKDYKMSKHFPSREDIREIISSDDFCILTAETIGIVFYNYSIFLSVPLALLVGALTIVLIEAYKKIKMKSESCNSCNCDK